MLVLIVVAAAIGFSLFVASEQKIVQAEEAAKRLQEQENVSVGSLALSNENTTVTLAISSLDVNNITITGMTVDGDPVQAFGEGPLLAPGCFSLASGTLSCANLPLPAFSLASVTVNGSDSQFSYNPFKLVAPIVVDLFTARSNEFVESFIPPVASFAVEYIGGYPLLDGATSYQPSGSSGVVATIDQWTWSVTCTSLDKTLCPSGTDDNGTYSNQETQLPNEFVAKATYSIVLAVMNTDGLTGTLAEDYTA